MTYAFDLDSNLMTKLINLFAEKEDKQETGVGCEV